MTAIKQHEIAAINAILIFIAEISSNKRRISLLEVCQSLSPDCSHTESAHIKDLVSFLTLEERRWDADAPLQSDLILGKSHKQKAAFLLLR
jgi:hypothetical protein